MSQVQPEKVMFPARVSLYPGFPGFSI